ncbi:signal transduction histidine kinase [Kibdelosporangium banguiense]|uniref:histidine kinase n=1 Tax=Kibdelosporangium banguiense TaxID=1365924 RepID=A0ABS4TGA8_9PSEU|nr:nitrate- and nitrite sensing domain-containing protein [Kibdelosporangium banguiense]MBP2323460.1 signal transduction histidine kinase [Kibdelosporangium banguiense]
MPNGDVSGTGRDRPLVRRLLAPRAIGHRLVRIRLASVTLVLVLLGMAIAGQLSDYSDACDTKQAVSLALTVQDLTQQLQRERDLTNGVPGGESQFKAEIGPQRVNTDKALATLTLAVAADDTPDAREVRSALDRLNAVISTRQNIDDGRADRTAAFQWYTAGIAALNEAAPGVGQGRDAELRNGLRALGELGAAKEATAQERGLLNRVFATGHFRAGEYIRFTEIRADKQAGLAAFQDDANVVRRAQLDQTLKSESAVQAAAAETVAISSAVGPIARWIDPVGWWAQMTSVVDQMWDLQRAVGQDLTYRASELRAEATSGLVVFLLLALLAVGLEITLVVGCLRSVVRPLAALAVQAHDVAARRLPTSVAGWHAPGTNQPVPPEPVRPPARAGSEIASVAQALDRVQSTAFELAGQQALVRRNTTESLADLGRRNQDLACRQLGFISALERDEPDPAVLANLFELDHLATRMRRNAESLLVLAGESSPRRGAEPLAITDVVRAGISGVEDYQRVSLRDVDDVYVTGAAVGELAHLLAELIDNALSFSPPDLPVEVYGRRAGVRYALTVADHGAGMSHEQLATANTRLRGEEDFPVAPTRFLGHYVAGRLAQRLGVQVELTQAPDSGINAQLLLPDTMLIDLLAPRAENSDEPAREIPAGNGSATGTATKSHSTDEWVTAGPAITQITRMVKRNPKRQGDQTRPAPVRPAEKGT